MKSGIVEAKITCAFTASEMLGNVPGQLFVFLRIAGGRIDRQSGGPSMNAKTQGKEWSVWVSGAMARNFCKIVDADQNIVAVVQNDPSGIVTQEDEANAELIVRCVNSHDKLIEALKRIAYGDPKGMPDDMIAAEALGAESRQREEG